MWIGDVGSSLASAFVTARVMISVASAVVVSCTVDSVCVADVGLLLISVFVTTGVVASWTVDLVWVEEAD